MSWWDGFRVWKDFFFVGLAISIVAIVVLAFVPIGQRTLPWVAGGSFALVILLRLWRDHAIDKAE